MGQPTEATPKGSVCVRPGYAANPYERYREAWHLPFVLASRQKYTTEPQTLRCRICFLTYRYNKLRVDVEGHLNAPVE
jgi:hypothetical protein